MSKFYITLLLRYTLFFNLKGFCRAYTVDQYFKLPSTNEMNVTVYSNDISVCLPNDFTKLCLIMLYDQNIKNSGIMVILT
jgi:hypothetical protein